MVHISYPVFSIGMALELDGPGFGSGFVGIQFVILDSNSIAINSMKLYKVAKLVEN